MQVCPSEENILAFVEERLPREGRTAIEGHIASCGPCGALLAAVASSWYEEGRLGPVPGPRRPGLAAGDRFGPYTIVARAGQGAMGDVYRARDERLGRDVALKVLPPDFAADRGRLARFRHEARAAGALSHPNLLTLFDVGSHGDVHYLVTEWLDGMTLGERLVAGPLPVARVLRMGLELARGLAAAHEKGLVHRDLKPANIFLCSDGSTRILDFGLAREAAAPQDARLTGTGEVVGTAGYMAPEQIRGLAVDPRADLFALGAVLFEALSGTAAFGGSSVVDRLSAALRDEPAVLEGLPGALIARCLAKDPANRFQSATDLAFALESLQGRPDAPSIPSPGHPPHLTPRGGSGWPPLLLGLAIMAVVVGSAVLGWEATGELPGPVLEPTYRPVTFRRGHVLSARFSADGHTLVYGAVWDGAEAELYTTRIDRPLAQSFGLVADVLAASPDGELAVLLEPRFYDPDHGSGTLAKMPLSGGAPRAVLEGVLEADWGRSRGPLAVVRRVGDRFRLEHPVGTVRFESEGWISHARVSPDGSRIAFLLHPNAKDDRGSVMLLEEEGPPRVLSGGWSSVRGLAWPPGGNEVWFTASRTDGDYALHAARLDGALRLVDRIAGRMVLQDIDHDGTALIDVQRFRIGLTVGRGGEERDLRGSDASFLTDLSADGRTLLFAGMDPDEGPSYGAYLQGSDGAPPVRLGDGLPMALSPDGAWVFVMRHGESGASFVLLPTAAGEPRPVSIAPIEALLGARWFPDGRRLLLRGSTVGGTARLWSFEPGSPPTPLSAEGDGFPAAIAPQGDRLAGVDAEGTLRVFSSTGAPLPAAAGSFPGATAVGWDEAGDAVYLRSTSLPARITRVDLRTGTETPHLTLPGGPVQPGLVSVMTVAISADGKTHAYSYHELLSRLYLVEGLSPAP